jgi:hypothetical protein
MHSPQMIERNVQPTVAGGRSETRRLLALGAVLILVGVAAVVARSVDVDLGALIGEQSWPALVIVPGLVLIGLAFVARPPDGLGFAIAGSIVTTIGMILLVQANTGAWASWAYVWTLIPGAAGIGMTIYGLLTRSRELVGNGARLAAIAGVLFIAGWWYFETLFTTGEQPADLGTWWPLVLIAVGTVIAIRALLTTRHGRNGVATPDIEGGHRS